MNFLVPLFLAGLAALAAPLLIHLTHRQRKEPIAFPSLMFLRRVEFRTTKRQRIRNRLLFALRALAVALLALAFARPFLQDDASAAAASDAGREVVILLDESFSMTSGDRWARARAAAGRVIDGLGPNDRATLVRFAARAQGSGEPTADKGALRAALATAKPRWDVGRIAPALALARTRLARTDRPRREVILVSDLQRGAWAPAEELRLPAGTAFRIEDVGEEGASNVTVASIEFARGSVEGREQVTATARVANRGAAPASDVPVTLALDGREVAAQRATIPANGAASVRLGPFNLPAATVRGTVRAGSDALDGDNLRHFTLDRGRALRVTIVQDPTTSPERTLFLRRALGVAGDPAFTVEVRRGELQATDLVPGGVVLLDDARPPRGEMARRLAEWVGAGGGVIATFGARARGSDWSEALAPMLPATPGEVVDRGGDGGRLGALDRTHPILEPFAGPRTGNFGAPRAWRYRPLALTEGAVPVARWDDGSVALAERRVGRGRVLAWGSTFDNVWNDFPLHPVFLPLVRQLAQHAAGWSSAPASRTVGDVLDLASLAPAGGTAAATAEYVAVPPAGEAVRLTAGGTAVGLTEPGTWEIRRFGARGAPLQLVAVNVDPIESDVGRVARSEVEAAIAPRAGDGAAGAGDAVPLTAAERESRQSLWWWMLVAATVLFAMEAVLANRLSWIGGVRRTEGGRA